MPTFYAGNMLASSLLGVDCSRHFRGTKWCQRPGWVERVCLHVSFNEVNRVLK